MKRVAFFKAPKLAVAAYSFRFETTILHMVKHSSSILFCAMFALGVWANDDTQCYVSDKPGRIREHNLDFVSLTLDIKLNAKAGKVFGKADYKFKPIQPTVDSVYLNAVNISTTKVIVNGASAKFVQDSAGLTVFFNPKLKWDTNNSMSIVYEATPRKGLYFIGWDKNISNKKNDKDYIRNQIWTQGQGIDNRHWIPCYDDVNDKLLTQTTITFDSAYTVVSNGVLKSKRLNSDGTYTWNYAMNKPMVPYLIMLAIDKYSFVNYTSKSGIVSKQYYYADHPELAEPTYRYSGDMMDFLASELQVKYPWQTYANVPVQNFMYGAMENTTATIFGDFLLNDERQNLERPYYSTNTHELTHQWFGDYITEYSATHHWLHESFATYYAKQFIRYKFGEDRYQWDKRNEANSAMAADDHDNFPVAHSAGGSQRHYPKGSHVIDMMRYVVGDSIFKKCITSYLKEHAYSNVHNHDLMMAFMDYAGINLDWFFDEWIYRSGYPQYKIDYKIDGNTLTVFIQQTQKKDELHGYFTMPLKFEAILNNGKSVQAVHWNQKPSDTVQIQLPGGTDLSYLLFDPADQIIKKVEFNKPVSMLKAQLNAAPNMIDRYDALVAMRDTPVSIKKEFLLQKFYKGDFHAIQSEILKQLASESDSTSNKLMQTALTHKDYLVRRTAIDLLEMKDSLLITAAELMLSDSSYINIESALRKLCWMNESKTRNYLAATDKIQGINKNVRTAWLEINIKQCTDSTQLAKLQNELTEYSSGLYEFRTRNRAFESIETLGLCTDQIVRNLIDGILSANSRLSNPAQRTLKLLMKKIGNKEIAQTVYQTSTWEPWQMERLKKIFEQ